MHEDEWIRLRPFAVAGADIHIGCLATLLERRRRIGEALDLLRSHLHDGGSFHVDFAEQIADVLARHDHAALAEFADGEGEVYGAVRLARLLEEQGRIDEALAVVRRIRNGHVHSLHVQMLTRHGRTDEAIEVLRRAADDDYEHYGLRLCRALIARGRPDEAIAVIDDVVRSGRRDESDVHMDRVEMLFQAGRTDESIALLRDKMEADDWFTRIRLAELLAELGRLDEAAESLEPVENEWTRDALAEILMRRGRAEEAVAVLRKFTAKGG